LNKNIVSHQASFSATCEHEPTLYSKFFRVPDTTTNISGQRPSRRLLESSLPSIKEESEELKDLKEQVQRWKNLYYEQREKKQMYKEKVQTYERKYNNVDFDKLH
jgi:hypothetical protein